MTHARTLRLAQVGFFVMTVTAATLALVVLGALSLAWLAVITSLATLLAVELGAPATDHPWWRTRAGPVAAGALVVYIAALSSASL